MLTPKILSKTFSSGVVLASSCLLIACGANSGIDAALNGDSPALTIKQVSGPLDPLQGDLVTGLLVQQIGGSMPAPLDSTVACLGAALNSLLDAPDSLLLALSTIGNGGDPVSSFQGGAASLQGSLYQFTGQMQAGLAILTGQQETCEAPAEGGGNPFGGTPLAPAGVALEQLIQALANDSDDEDPNLRPLAAGLAPALDELSTALAHLPEEVTGAPVLGGVFLSLEAALNDLGLLLPALADYDARGTQAGVESLLNNLLGNVLLNTLPIGEIDAATGQDVSGQIQAGIDQASAELGDGLGQLITPAFNEALNGALKPVLDPVEGLLAQLLTPLGNAGPNPLDALLGLLARDGKSSPLDPLLALLIAGAADAPLSDLTAQLSMPAPRTLLEELFLLTTEPLALDDLLVRLANAGAGAPILGEVLNGDLG